MSKAKAERQCVQCARTFRGRSNLLCSRCNAHPCESCGRVFPGYGRHCNACRTKERICADCGNMFRGREVACPACRATERECESCGAVFRGVLRKCLDCRATARTCTGCAVTYQGRQDRCRSCRNRERTCENCGNRFRGDMKTCRKCQATERTCTTCGTAFLGSTSNCWRCNGASIRAPSAAGQSGHPTCCALVAAPTAGPASHAARLSGDAPLNARCAPARHSRTGMPGGHGNSPLKWPGQYHARST